MGHIITSRITEFKRKKLSPPEGYCFNSKIGAWVSDSNVDEILVKAKGRPPQGTKKNDIETGEDLKSQ